MKRSYSVAVLQRSGLIAALAAVMCGCISQPRVATSFWRIGTPADSLREGYAILHEGAKVRHCYPITEWTEQLSPITNNQSPLPDTYHQLHHHGVAVESELMAYRIYFDKKQTIDPYCKRKPQLELSQSHWYPNDSLLALGYGDDILRVSGTVGVGSVKYWNGKKHVHIEPVSERSQRIVSQSRTSATIEVAVKGWQIPTAKRSYSETVLQSEGRSYSDSGRVTDMTVRYTMKAGHRDMRCDVTLSDTISGLCTGVQFIPKDLKNPKDLKDFITLQLPNGTLLASFGTDWPVNDTVKFAKETVGLAVFIPKEFAGSIVQDKSNLLCLLHLTGTESAGPTAQRPYRDNGPTAQRSYSDNGLTAQRSEMCVAHFYLTCVGATKENHPVATTAEEWFVYLRKWANGLK